MTTILRRLAALLVSLLVVVGAFAAPAQADVNGCGINYLCLHDPTNFGNAGQGVRRYSKSDILASPGQCKTLGSDFVNRTSSVIYNATFPSGHSLLLFPNNGCVGTPLLRIPTDAIYQDNDLTNAQTTDQFGNVSTTNFSNVINSIAYS